MRTRSNNAMLILFLAAFFIYLLTGFLVTYCNSVVLSTFNVFWGADSPRVYIDLTAIQQHHFRADVHPLQLVLLQPVVSLANGFLHSPLFAAITVQALVSGTNTILIYSILKKIGGGGEWCCIMLLYNIYNFIFNSCIYRNSRNLYFR